MKTVDTSEFLAWAAYRGVHLDARYEPPQTLTYPNGKMTIVPIELPTAVSKWKSILNAVFCLLPRTPLWLHRRGGVWDFLSFSGEEYTSLRQGYNAILQEIRVPKGEFALQFSADEHPKVLALLALHALTATGMRDDVFVVPETAEFVIWVDHDDQLILICRNPEVERGLREKAQKWGMELPPAFRPEPS